MLRTNCCQAGQRGISIWFFIGLLLLIYGIIIVGLGLYGLVSPPDRVIVLGRLHAGIWWGALLIALGAVYSYYFRPGR